VPFYVLSKTQLHLQNVGYPKVAWYGEYEFLDQACLAVSRSSSILSDQVNISRSNNIRDKPYNGCQSINVIIFFQLSILQNLKQTLKIGHLGSFKQISIQTVPSWSGK
jgi:hypothetical protein